MVEIAVCDDSEYTRENIRKALLDYSLKKELEYSVDEYSSGESMLDSEKKYDLIFMDYQFEKKDKDGIEIVRMLRAKNDDATIIFLSSYPEAVFDSFKVGAFRFLVKPLDNEKFNEALDAFVNTLGSEQILEVREIGKKRFVNENDILYIEGSGKRSILYFENKKDTIECNETLSSIEDRLVSKMFYRCQKSYIVNLAHVSGYNYSAITLDNGSVVLISRKKYKEFMEVYGDYIMSRRTGV